MRERPGAHAYSSRTRSGRAALGMTGLLALATLLAGIAAVSAQPAPRAAAFIKGDGGQEFFPFVVDEDALAGAADRAGVNQPLTAASRLFVRDARFFAVGADGRPNTADDQRVRLFGVNLSFASNFPSAADAPKLAKRLRKLGMNAVRLHHMDSFPSDDTRTPGSILTTGPFPSFNAEAVKRLRGLIGALAAEGIYVDLNLHVGYRFRPDVDGLPQPKGVPGVAPIGNPLHVYYPRMIELQEQYARGLIRALNLRGSPSLAMVEINNESSLLAAWQWRQWSYAVPEGYAGVLLELWQTWLARKYGTPAQACAAWTTCTQPVAPIPLLTPADADVADIADSRVDRLRQRLSDSMGKVAAYLPGAGTAQANGAAPAGKSLRTQDFLQFLADTDKSYFDRMRAVVKAETDALVPVTGTQMAYGGALNFDSQSGMDYIDEHIYVGHPDFPAKTYNPRDWRIRDVAPTGGVELRRLLAMSFRRDRSKPFIVSEYSQPFPNPRGTETIPLLAAIAALQDWDGLFYFDYTYVPEGLAAPSNFSLSGDWGKYAMAGPSAQLYRLGWIPTLREAVALPLPLADRLAIAASPAFDALDADVGKRLGTGPDLGLRAQVAMDTAAGAGKDFRAPPAAPSETPDRSVVFDADKRLATLRSRYVWGAFGDVGGSRVEGDGIAGEFLGRAGAHAGLLVTPVDFQPLATSRRWLVSLGAWTTGTQAGSRPPRPKELIPYKGDKSWLTLEPDATASGQPSGATETSGPGWVVRTPLRLTWALSQPKLTVYPLDGKGRRMAALGTAEVQIAGGQATVTLQASAAQASPWYEFVIGADAAPGGPP